MLRQREQHVLILYFHFQTDCFISYFCFSNICSMLKTITCDQLFKNASMYKHYHDNLYILLFYMYNGFKIIMTKCDSHEAELLYYSSPSQ
jgi:hypothetical protein